MLIIDGVKYNLWKPKNEESPVPPSIKNNYSFGENSLYFDLKKSLFLKSETAKIPYAYAVKLTEPKVWFIIKNKLSSKDNNKHNLEQVSKFMSSIKEVKSQNDLAKIFWKEIEKDSELKSYVKKRVGLKPLSFLTELLSTPPKIALILNALTPQLRKIVENLNSEINSEILEFKTFIGKDDPKLRYHKFKIISTEKNVINKKTNKTKARTEKSKKYYQFHTKFLQELKNKYPTFTKAKIPSDGAWMSFGGKKTGFVFDTIFSKKGAFYIGYRIKNGPNDGNREYVDILIKQKNEIAKEVDEDLKCEFEKNNTIFWIGTYRKNITIDSSENDLKETIFWGVDFLPKLQASVMPRVA